ncbi:MAG TPA: hypothetical protein VK524_09370, partial [Polyangiaceae bacterium]|nr:hypothetical protein [Polyangiaceae bacterium]
RTLANPGDRLVLAFGASIWLTSAALVGFSGLLAFDRPALIPGSILTLSALLVWLYSRGGALRRVADQIDLRAIILAHAIRAPIGAYFLWKTARGELDPMFAWVGGPGDIAAGSLSLVAAALVPLRTQRRRLGVWLWNIGALIDILLTAGTAARILLFSGHPETMSALLAMPGPLLPLFIVPLVITSHLLLLRRLRME